MADNIQATPRNYVGGLLSDAYKWMQSPERTQQMQMFAGLLGTTGIPQTVERMAYGEPLTNIGKANVPLLKPETADALMTVGGLLPEVNIASKAIQKAKFIYPQEEALRLAQQRAALPVEQGGLGLLSNNTAAERAKAMGFDTPALHGSGTPDIKSFDPSLVGSKAGNPFDNYMWSTSSPDAASAYSLNPKSFNELPEVKALNAKIQDIAKATSDAYKNSEFDKMSELQKQKVLLQKQTSDLYKEFQKGNILSEESTVYPLLLKTDEFMPYEAGGKNWMSVNRQAIDESKDAGFQGVAIKNVKDNPNREVNKIVADTYATENPDLMRSRFAAFDPWRRTAATAAAMGVAAPDLLAQEQPIITQQQIDNEVMKYGLLGR